MQPPLDGPTFAGFYGLAGTKFRREDGARRDRIRHPDRAPDPRDGARWIAGHDLSGVDGGSTCERAEVASIIGKCITSESRRRAVGDSPLLGRAAADLGILLGGGPTRPECAWPVLLVGGSGVGKKPCGSDGGTQWANG